MSPAGPIAVVVSCGVHLALLAAVWGAPPPAPAPQTANEAAIEVEVRSTKVEPPPPPPEKHEAPPPISRRRGSAPSLPPVTTIEFSRPAVAAVGGVPGDQPPVPGGSGGTDDEGAVVVSKPPPPPPDTSVELLSLPRIVYPENARAEGVEGRVRLWVQLDETGRVLSVEVLDEPGSGLGAAARKALLDATFKPPTHLGLREATAFEYVYRFQLL